MGTVHKFRRPPKTRGQFRGQAPRRRPPRKPPSRRWGLHPNLLAIALLLLAGAIAGSGTIWRWITGDPGATFACSSVDVLDGDTFRCGDRRVRLAGIDAPELPGHCREGRECTPGDSHASTASLARLTRWQAIQCRQTDLDAYGRTVARCTAGETDLSCAQLGAGQAVRRYGWIWC
jgi:endonuclease YncB( thermonuclease family)